jgi:FkbM family methyltransferase
MGKGIRSRFRRTYKTLSNLRVVNRRKLFELWEQQHLKRLLTDYAIDCVFDVGANYGQYAEMLRRRVGYKGLIVSFEPIPEAAAVLRTKAKRDPRWIVEEVALARQDGHQTFHIMKGSQFSSLSEPYHDVVDRFRDKNAVASEVTVKTENLATTFARLQPTLGFHRPFLKLDTQGYDVEIVSAAREVLPNFCGLQSELAVKRVYAQSIDFRDAITLYQECGFELTAFVPNNSGHFPQLIETDCIMLRRDLWEASVAAGPPTGRRAVTAP